MKNVMTEIALADIVPSKTNTRSFDERDLEELVESIKRQGVLQPILVRPSKDGFEIVAGERRYRASKKAGLEKIPANVREMDDIEAREAQIVENLQRKDIHPMDEGEAYRQLVEAGKLEIKDVAARVGKDEKYVRGRLALTNLFTKAVESYRKGKITDGVAALMARLEEGDQKKALAMVNGSWHAVTVKMFQEWIEREIMTPLESQPWMALDEKTREEMVGACKECTPDTATLFGEVKKGACTSLACWGRKMKAWMKALEKTHVKISDAWGQPEKGVVARGKYVLVGKAAKDRCDSLKTAVIADGSSIGRIVDVCMDEKCAKHAQVQEGDGGYRRTPQEKAARKKAKLEAAKREAKETEGIRKALEKLKWPMTEKQLDLLFELAFEHVGTSLLQPIVKRRGLKPVTEKSEGGYVSRDYAAPLKELAEKDGKNGKVRMIFELLLPGYDEEERKRLLKKL